MSLYNIFGVAGAGMTAQSVRLNTVASNLANSGVTASSPKAAYRAREPVFAAYMPGGPFSPQGAQGTQSVRIAGIVTSNAPPVKEYQPNNPLADAKGYVYKSNVNPVSQMADMISASRSYQGDVQVMQTAKQLMERTLNLASV